MPIGGAAPKPKKCSRERCRNLVELGFARDPVRNSFIALSGRAEVHRASFCLSRYSAASSS